MKMSTPNLLVEINNLELIFVVFENENDDRFKILLKKNISAEGVYHRKILNYDLAFKSIRKNIYLIEEQLNLSFKDVVLILNNIDCSFINLTGYKKLNGSQILKENISYIINSVKSNIDEIENKKTILHIFNSKYCLDKKNVENLPIGLFGDFYSHELSFNLIKDNDFKNLNKIFNNCNLKIKKIFLKSFVEGVYISNNKNLKTFLKVEIQKNSVHFFYFENDSLKFEQSFDFGLNLIINDISKITSLKKDIVKKILLKSNFSSEVLEENLLEKEFFQDENYRKIKKKLIHDIAKARIQELSEVIIIKNINLKGFLKKDLNIFLELQDEFNFECLKNSYKFYFSKNNYFSLNFIKKINADELMYNANKIAHFGWKKEAVPVIHSRKTILARFFDAIFN